MYHLIFISIFAPLVICLLADYNFPFMEKFIKNNANGFMKHLQYYEACDTFCDLYRFTYYGDDDFQKSPLKNCSCFKAYLE